MRNPVRASKRIPFADTLANTLADTVGSVRGISVLAASACVLLAATGCSENSSSDRSASSSSEGSLVERHSEEIRRPDRDRSIADDTAAAAEVAQFSMVEQARAEIEPTEGYSAQGTARFSPSEDKRAMLVTLELKGLTPGKHGLHIHANGDCSNPDASSAGGHFDPYGTNHGSLEAREHHLGDLGNIEANKEGNVSVELRAADLAFSGPASILQRAVVIHAKADDLKSNPSGKSGDRVACGVIRQVREVLVD